MENFSMNTYEPIMFNNTSINTNNLNNCRKKLNFNDQTNNLNEMVSFNTDTKQHKKYKKNMAIVSGTVQVQQSNPDLGSTYQKTEPNQIQLKHPKIPSNTKRNARERKRVRTINDYFSQLQKFLPHSKQATSHQSIGSSSANCSVNSTKKLSKVETLKAAIEYIEYLQAFSPLSNHKTINLPSSLSSSPLSTSSNSNSSNISSSSSSSSSITVISPSSSTTLISPAKTSFNQLNASMLSEINTNSKLKLNKAAALFQSQKQSLKSRLNKALLDQAPIQFDHQANISPIATVQPLQHQAQHHHPNNNNNSINEPSDFNLNYNNNGPVLTNDSYYYTQQCYNSGSYMSYSSPSTTPAVSSPSFKTEYYNTHQLAPQSQLVRNQSSFYPHYNMECESDQLMTSSRSINHNLSPSSSPESRTASLDSYRTISTATVAPTSTPYTNASYATISSSSTTAVNYQEQNNLMISNHHIASYNNTNQSLNDYQHTSSQINC